MITFHLISLFPEVLAPYLESSILGRALKTKKLAVKYYNPRAFAPAKNAAGYTQVDNKPYGGGPGMVMEALPLLRAVAKVKIQNPNSKKKNPKVIILSPRGEQFTNDLADKLAKEKDLILISGRYEGIDGRVKKILKAKEVSVGPYTLTGGEVPILAMVDAIARRLPGVLGKDESVEERRVALTGGQAGGEVYTRPEVLIWPLDKAQGKQKKYRVPKVLLSGNHKKIDLWRQS
jgi:tRNA (guanine37-N1)-methyltransferase